MWNCFIFPLLGGVKQEEKAPQPHFCKYLQHTPAAKHTGFPHRSPSAPAQECTLLPSAQGTVRQPCNAAADEDVSSFCQSFLWYFLGNCVPLLMIPTFAVQVLNHPHATL